MSEFTTKFREAFASRPSYEDTSYCAPIGWKADIKPEVLADLVAIATNAYISPEEITDFGNKWRDGKAMLKEIDGENGAALMQARVNYLKDQVDELHGSKLPRFSLRG